LGLEYTRKRRDAIAQALLDDEADRSDEPADWDAAALRPVDPEESDDSIQLPVEQTADRPPGVRRARRDARAAADEVDESGTTYRGRRARRHG
ncbi:MAG TPA: hypothetical protein VJ644_05630, partial [Jiangellaceae bacterium]|nr:hypothetical protein [Jiangellaceae bacterium]